MGVGLGKTAIPWAAALFCLAVSPCAGALHDALPPEVGFAGNLLANPSFEATPPPTPPPTMSSPTRPASGCGIEAVIAGSFLCGGGITYNVTVPDPSTHSAPWGLIFHIHGGKMSSTSMEANTDMSTLGTGAGYVVVTPNSPHQLLGNAVWRPDVDVAQVASTLLDLVNSNTGRIDRNRVHSMGFSMGGFMTW